MVIKLASDVRLARILHLHLQAYILNKLAAFDLVHVNASVTYTQVT